MDELRIMSYNVRYDTPEDGKDAWPHRRDATASVVRFHEPDLVGFQEPDPHQVEDLRERLSEYRIVGVGRDDGEEGGEFGPIGYRIERFELLESETFWLSETPERPGSVGWDAAMPRIVTWARLRDRTNGSELFHFNTHLSYHGERARRESARILRDRVTDRDGDVPAIVTGDFNCVAGSRPHTTLAGDGSPLRDTMAAADAPHHGPETSFTDFSDLIPDRLIDHVLVTEGTEVRRHGVLADLDERGRFPSDHLPVLAIVDVPGH